MKIRFATAMLTAATLGSALACGGAPPPVAPIRTAPPAPLPPPGVDRVRHDGLPDAAGSWEAFVATPTQPAFMVILWGSTDEQAAWAWLERYWRAGGKMRPGPGYPKVIASKWYKGLKPGFWLVVAAEPADRAVAERAEKLLGAVTLPDVDVSGVYVREVESYLPERELDPASLVP